MKHLILIFASILGMTLPAVAQDATPEANEAPAAASESAGSQPDAAALASPARPPRPQAKSLDELLRVVREGFGRERLENRRREEEFKSRHEEQGRLLAEATAGVAALESRSDSLEAAFEANESELGELEETRTAKLGNLGELFGVVRQVAGDTAGNVEASLVNAQFPGRHEVLAELGQSRTLPSIEKLEKLWYALQHEMTESGRVVRFPATVVVVGGDRIEAEVTRAGVFTAISDGKFLTWIPESQKLSELARQPSGRHLAVARNFEAATTGAETLAIDPSRGAILRVLVQTPNAGEQVEQGGVIGYAIIALGVAAGLFGVFRIAQLSVVSRKVKAQRAREEPDESNPRGRVIGVYTRNQDVDAETLELKLDEAVLRETSKLERFAWMIQVVSVIAPLMGLLGTVTGMIRTFQVMTLFGTGDPKLMAGGISEALVTTMLGLIVAIPLLLLHSLLSSMSENVSDVLEEQSAGLVASRAEERLEGKTA